MSTITATVGLGKQALPSGLTEGSFQITWQTPGVPDVVQVVTDLSQAVLPNATPGVVYTVEACRLAVTGERLSPLVTATIAVPAAVPAQIDVPVSITLALG